MIKSDLFHITPTNLGKRAISQWGKKEREISMGVMIGLSSMMTMRESNRRTKWKNGM